MLKRFTKKIIFFFIPIFIVLSPPLLILIGTGESPLDYKELNSRVKPIIGFAYNQKSYEYLKWSKINTSSKFEVISLGSSRVLQFRENMFNVPFYNAGYTISSITDFKPFLESISKEKYPKYLIIGLDQWMFNEKWDDLQGEKSKRGWSKSYEKYPSGRTIIRVYWDLINGKYSFNILKDKGRWGKIGLDARLNGKGLRNDGSMLYGNIIEKLLSGDKDLEDYNYSNTFERIDNGNKRFEYADYVNVNAKIELDVFLDFCKKNSIEVVAFLPPFADKVIEKMKAKGKYGYVDKIYSEISPIFTKYDYEIFDFSSVSILGSNDMETLDGFHGGEVTYLKLLLKMVEGNSIIKNVVKNDLKQDLMNTQNRYLVYEY